MDAAVAFGKVLRRLRNEAGLTQEELALRVGCAEVTIFKIEANERRPSKQIAELLAQHLMIPLADHAAFVKFARIEAALTTDAPWGTPFHPVTNLPSSPTPLYLMSPAILWSWPFPRSILPKPGDVPAAVIARRKI